MIETLHGTRETVNFKKDSRLRLYINDDNEQYPPHWHSPLEIILPTRNEYRVECCRHGIALQEGDLFIIAPGVIHSLSPTGRGTRLIFQADFSQLNGIKDMNTTLSIISPFLHLTPETHPNIHNKACHLLYSIRDEYDGDSFLSEAAIYGKLIELFVLIGRDRTKKTELFDSAVNKQKEYAEKFLHVCDYIREHCTEQLTLDGVSALAGFSKFHFTRLFKQFTNVSFYKYLNQNRIAYAENLLINPDISITEVAMLSGFGSLSSFIRMFKIIKECTPTEFRSMYIQDS